MTGMDLDLVKGNKKGFYKYTGNKRKTRGTVTRWLSRAWNPGTKEMKKAEILRSFCASVLTGKICPETSQVSAFSGRDWEIDT